MTIMIRIKEIIFVALLLVTFSVNAQKVYQGMTFHKGKPLENVIVVVNEGGNQTKTDKNGRYKIQAKIGDDIFFNYVDMKQAVRRILKSTFVLNVTMESIETEELKNVTVTDYKKRLGTQKQLALAYNSNVNIIKTGFGFLNKETVGFGMIILDEKDINPGAENILSVIIGKFPGTTICKTKRGTGICMRGGQAIYEIDGMIFESAPLFLDVSTIKRIARIAGLAGTMRYGSIAAGGIFIINTKGATMFYGRSERKDWALAKNNIYKSDAITLEQEKKNRPSYFNELYACTTLIEAKEVYLKYLKNYETSEIYFLDSYAYFSRYWNKSDYSKGLIRNKKEFSNNSTSFLKALAYYLDANGEEEMASELYKKVFIKEPNRCQSYRDLANSYQQIGDINKAIDIYIRYNYLLNQEFLTEDGDDVFDLIGSEFNMLQRLKRASITPPSSKLTKKEEPEKGVRIVFEWSSENADIALQFVNPKNKFYRWSNISKSIAVTSSSKQFFINHDMPGKWLVNIMYKNKDIKPTYMKTTIYTDYGKPTQQQKTQVHRLSLKDVNQHLFDINVSAK